MGSCIAILEVHFFFNANGLILLQDVEIREQQRFRNNRKHTSKYTGPYRDCEEPGTVIGVSKLTGCVLRILYLGENKKKKHCLLILIHCYYYYLPAKYGTRNIIILLENSDFIRNVYILS